MIKLVDVLDRESRPAVLLSGTDMPCRVIPFVAGSYELATSYANSGLSWSDYIDGLAAPDSGPDGHKQRGVVPFMPESPYMATVYSFGYTHSTVNGKKVEKGNLDFYYKGPGNLLVTDGARLTGTSPMLGGGIEVEYCAMYCVNETGQAVYLGHTLANDFSDAGLRTANRNLANLSKLQPSVVSSHVLLDDLPVSSRVSASVERGGIVTWKRDGVLGTQAMIYSRRLLERLLLGKRGLLLPGVIVYLLLGACISSHKDGVELRDADRITVWDHGSGLTLSNCFTDWRR